MKARLKRHSRAAGFTLIELLIALAIMAIVFSSLALVMGSSLRLHVAGTFVSHLEAEVNRSMNRLARELMNTGVSVLFPDPGLVGNDTLTFQAAVGIVDEATVWGAPIRLAFEYDEGEVDDGLDNNGNGLIDEGRVVWTENPGTPGEKRVVWCNEVREFLEGETRNGMDDNGNGLIDETGLSFQREGESLTIMLTLERLDADGRMVTRTQETLVELRN